MCWMVAIPLAMMAASAVISGIGAQQSAAAQQGALNYQAQVARNNASIAGQQAVAETAAGEATAQAKLLESAQRGGGIRAAAAASGLDPNVGTPLNLQSDQAKLGMLDAMTIRNNAARRAYQYQVGGMSDVAQSQLDTAGAANARTAGDIATAGSIVGGAANVSSKWYGYQLRAGAGAGGGGLLN